jgi:hypothetical protein
MLGGLSDKVIHQVVKTDISRYHSISVATYDTLTNSLGFTNKSLYLTISPDSVFTVAHDRPWNIICASFNASFLHPEIIFSSDDCSLKRVSLYLRSFFVVFQTDLNAGVIVEIHLL